LDAALILLAVVITSCVIAALDAKQPSISRTATLVMSKYPRLMSFQTLDRLAANCKDRHTAHRGRFTRNAGGREL
jgi:hypothetical protein